MRDQFIDTKTLAQLTQTSVVTWARRRCNGDGPPYHQLGRAIRYMLSDVEDWLKRQERQSTSETR